MLPDDVTAALAGLGLAASSAEAITGLPTDDDRLTLRVELVGGGTVKVRRCRWLEQARRYQQLGATFPGLPLSRVLGRTGRVCVEEWIPGTSLVVLAPTERRIAAAADLLGGLHTASESGPRPLVGFVRRLCRQLVRLAVDERIDRELALRITRRLLGSAPPRAAWGVIHFDLCAENLVEDKAGTVVAVDNERLHRGFLDFDLARTWYRWSMSAAVWTTFRTAYGRWRAPPSTSWDFWCIAALATSATLRLRGGAPRADEPLHRLDALTAR